MGRRARVRNRLVVGVALVGVTVVVAGAPTLLRASEDLNDAQNLVTLAQLNQQAMTLAHSLADERDEVVVYIAAGREAQTDDAGGSGGGKKDKREVSDARTKRVDRQIDEIRADTSVSPGLLRDLSTVPSIRRAALTGKGSALEAHRAYSDVIAKLQDLADEVAERTPAEAADGTRAPSDLGRAVEHASATRGLLLAALAVPGARTTVPTIDPVTGLPVESPAGGGKKDDETRDALTAAAQQSRVRELGALADFDQAAGREARDSLVATVTGPDIKAADGFLARLTDSPELSDSDREADPEKVESALSARIDQLRGVESGLGSSQVARLEKRRDDDVTGLELRIALIGGCLLIAVGISTAVARTLTRPLAVLRIGAARLAAAPGTEEPIRFTGRNDEFAQVVRSLNGLHGQLVELSSRTERLDGDRTDLIGARAKVAAQRAELQDRTAELGRELEQLRHTVHHTFVNLSLRTLGLVERQLAVIEGLEEREQEPDRLATLFKIDHMATVMRRHSENLLLLAGHDHPQVATGPVPLVDVVRASVSEIERYERVTIEELPPHAQVSGFAADDLSHLMAELLENAVSFSPPDAEVQLSGWLLETGEVMLSVQDHGIGVPAKRLAELNARLTDVGPEPAGGPTGEGLGLRVSALLAARHGVRVELREHEDGGVAAVVVLPLSLLPGSPPAAEPHEAAPAGKAPTFRLPGSVAESNSNALPGRPERDPLVVAAEQAIEKAEAEAARAEGSEAKRAAAGAPSPAEPEDADAAEEALWAAAEAREASAHRSADHADADAEAAGHGPAARPGTPDAEAALTEVALTGGPDAGRVPTDSADPDSTDPDSTDQDSAEADGPTAEDAEAAEEALWAAAEARDAAKGLTVPSGPAAPEDAEPAEEALWAAAEARGGSAAPAAPAGTDDAEEAFWAAAEARNAAQAGQPPAAAAGLPATAGPEATTGPGPYAIGPDSHARTPDDGPRTPGAPDQDTFTMRLPRQRPETPPAEGDDSPAPERARVTDKGLPKRTPRIVAPTTPAPQERTGSVDAEDLRRRLGGFHQGAKDGRRDVEAELTEQTEPEERTAVHTGETGETVEEARS